MPTNEQILLQKIAELEDKIKLLSSLQFVSTNQNEKRAEKRAKHPKIVFKKHLTNMQNILILSML